MEQSHLLSSTEDLLQARTKRWLSFPMHHRLYAHPSLCNALFGLFILTSSLSCILLSNGMVVAANMTSIPACLMLFVIFPWLMLVPCKCGKQPLLTVLSKREIYDLSKEKLILLILIVTFTALSSFLIHPVVKELLSLAPVHVLRLVRIILFASGIGYGALLLVMGLTGNVNWLYKELVSEREQQRISDLLRKSELSMSELDELLGYQLKLGEVDKADETSKLLLSVAERAYSQSSNA